MPSGNSYSLSFSNQPVTITQTPYSYANPAWKESGTSTRIDQIPMINNIAATASATCSGACGTVPVNVAVSPMLFGANATGLAAGIATSIPGGEQTASVQAYKR